MNPTYSTKSILSKRSIAKPIKEDEEIIDMLIVIPPDGGWGWVIVIAVFFMNLVMDGTMYTFGLFLDEISASFNKPKTKVAVANSLMSGFFYLVGPLVSALTNKYGFRIVAIMGGILSCVTILVSAALNSLPLFYLVYGIFGGMAFSMVYIPAIVIVGFYFEKWRAIATAIAACGSSSGIIVFPTVMQLLNEYDLTWRAKFQIISLTCIAMAILAITFRPLRPSRVLGAGDREKKIVFTISEVKEEPAAPAKKKRKWWRKLCNKFHNTSYPTAADVHRGRSGTIILEEARNLSSLSVLVEPTSLASFSLKSIRSKLSKTSTWVSETGDRLQTVEEEDDPKKNRCKKCCFGCLGRLCICYFTKSVRTSARPMYRDDIFYHGSVSTLGRHSKHSRSIASNAPGVSNPKSGLDYHMSVTRSMTAKDFEEDYFCKCCPIAIKRTLITMLDFNLMKSPSFLLLVASSFFTVLGMYAPFAFITDRVELMDMDKTLCLFILSAMGVANTAGRIVGGIVLTFSLTDARTYSYVTLGIAGISCLVSGLNSHVYYQYTYACVYAFNVACVGSIKTILIVELLGLDKLTNAFGILMTFQGIACLAGVPIAGILKDLTDDYDASFYFAGACIILGMIFLIPMQRVANWEHAKLLDDIL